MAYAWSYHLINSQAGFKPQNSQIYLKWVLSKEMLTTVWQRTKIHMNNTGIDTRSTVYE
jgi:hypothetical protein